MRAGLNTFQLESTQIKPSPKQENPIKTKDQYRLGHFFPTFLLFLFNQPYSGMRVLLVPNSGAPFPGKLRRVLAGSHSHAHFRLTHGFLASLWIPSERHQSGTLEIDTMTRGKRYLILRLGCFFLLFAA